MEIKAWDYMVELIKYILTIELFHLIGLTFFRLYGSEVAMNNISIEKHEELIDILSELIKIIELMQKEDNNYLLSQNAREANDWIIFLREHTDKGELQSLEKEIADRFFYKFDVQIGKSTLDNKRVELIKKYLFKSNEYLK